MEVPRTVGEARVTIRVANADELPIVIDIERRSSVRFREVDGLEHWVDDVTEMSDLWPALEREMVWVATVGDEPVGWCYASVVDDSLFVEQVDVLPDFGRRGVGGRLLDTVSTDSGARGLRAVTLTTDAHVPWNRPWYEKVGFRVLAPDEVGPQLAAKVAHEAERGLDLTRRVAMRRDL
jgi:GNAT superfamily N-acetyltransferase